MPGCLGCPTSGSTTISGIWTDFREHYGPKPGSMNITHKISLYNEDLDYYSSWASDHGIADPLNDSNYAIFRKWFGWKLMFGSTSGGNLPTRLRTHIGLSCAPCPYDTNCDNIRATHMVGSVPLNQSDHGIYYMKIEQKGSKWGFICTYSGCPYFIDTGQNYFYV